MALNKCPINIMAYTFQKNVLNNNYSHWNYQINVELKYKYLHFTQLKTFVMIVFEYEPQTIRAKMIRQLNILWTFCWFIKKLRFYYLTRD